MAQIQFSLIKKKKIGRPEHSLPPPPPTFDSISFLPYPHPLQSGHHMCITPYVKGSLVLYINPVNNHCNNLKKKKKRLTMSLSISIGMSLTSVTSENIFPESMLFQIMQYVQKTSESVTKILKGFFCFCFCCLKTGCA